jgi:Tol biopolymer transport system component
MKNGLATGGGLPCRTGRDRGSARGATFIIHPRHGFFVQMSLSGRKTTLRRHSSLFAKKAPSVFRNGQFSQDGKWVAYASNETGKWEVCVTSFPDARGRWQISSGGGEQPRWRGDGKELFYLSLDGKMMGCEPYTDTTGTSTPNAPSEMQSRRCAI